MLFVKRVVLLNWPPLAELGVCVCAHRFPCFDCSQDLTKLLEVVTPALVTAATSSNMELCRGVSVSAEWVQFGLQDGFRFQN